MRRIAAGVFIVVLVSLCAAQHTEKKFNFYGFMDATMTKMFASDDGDTFIDEASVKLFLDQVFGRGVRKTKSPMMTHAADHSLWVMPPNVKSANAMTNLLKRIVGDDYKVINVAGSGVTKLKVVKDTDEHNFLTQSRILSQGWWYDNTSLFIMGTIKRTPDKEPAEPTNGVTLHRRV